MPRSWASRSTIPLRRDSSVGGAATCVAASSFRRDRPRLQRLRDDRGVEGGLSVPQHRRHQGRASGDPRVRDPRGSVSRHQGRAVRWVCADGAFRAEPGWGACLSCVLLGVQCCARGKCGAGCRMPYRAACWALARRRGVPVRKVSFDSSKETGSRSQNVRFIERN